MGIFDKAKDALSDHGDKVDEHIDKAGAMADERTGGKYTEHIDKGEDFASDKVSDFLGSGAADRPTPTPPAAAPPAQ